MILSTVLLFLPKILFGFFGNIFNIVVAIILLLLIGLWFKPSFKGTIKPETSLLFGLSHVANAMVGAALPVAITQAFATVFMGIFFASLYIRSGSIVVPVLAHGVWDFIALSTDITAGDNAIMTQQTIDAALVLAVLTNVAVAIYAIWVMNKDKDTIRHRWEEKWSGQ